jgi:hypothetical protein
MDGKWLTYAGRALALLWAGTWTLFGLMSGIGEGMDLVGVVTHTVIPGLVFLLAAVIAWRWEPWGASALVGMGVWAMLAYPYGRTAEGLMMLSLPPILAASLLLAGWWTGTKHGAPGAV